MSDLATTAELVSNPVFWGMLAVIYLGLTPFVCYGVAVIGANLTGKPVPRFFELVSMILGQGRPAQDDLLRNIMLTTQDILAQVGDGAPRATAPETEEGTSEAKSQEIKAAAPENEEEKKSTAWADRRRSNRGAAARGTGYAGASPKGAYEPNVGTRKGDRVMFSDDLRAALKRLQLLGEELPDVAQLTRAYKDAAKISHPDRGGSIEAFLEVKSAYELILQEIGAARRGVSA